MFSQSTKVKVLYLTFGVLFACGLLLFIRHNINSSFVENEETRSRLKDTALKPIRNVATIDQWNLATKYQRVVLFVDADCNGWTLAYKDRLDTYSKWFRSEYGYSAIFIDTSIASGSPTWDPANIDLELFDLLQELWKTHAVPTGAMKSWGGAGTVAWLKDGDIVDHEFIGLLETLDEMRTRTNIAFRSP